LVFLVALSGTEVCQAASGAKSGDPTLQKLQTYNAARDAQQQLQVAIKATDTQIKSIQPKIEKYQGEVDSGVNGASAVLDGYQKISGKLEQTKTALQIKLKQVNALVEQLRKDPDISAVIGGQEATEQMSEKLGKAMQNLNKLSPPRSAQ
jgi:chromosome segregation ATPase